MGQNIVIDRITGKAICRKCGKFAVPIGKVLWCGCTK